MSVHRCVLRHTTMSFHAHRLAKALSPTHSSDQEDKQIITAKLTELKRRHDTSQHESGWPVLMVFNNCELVRVRCVGISSGPGHGMSVKNNVLSHALQLRAYTVWQQPIELDNNAISQ